MKGEGENIADDSVCSPSPFAQRGERVAEGRVRGVFAMHRLSLGNGITRHSEWMNPNGIPACSPRLRGALPWEQVPVRTQPPLGLRLLPDRKPKVVPPDVTTLG